MENKELENIIETSWESREEINDKTVGIAKEAVEQTLNLLGNGSLRVAEKKRIRRMGSKSMDKKSGFIEF